MPSLQIHNACIPSDLSILYCSQLHPSLTLKVPTPPLLLSPRGECHAAQDMERQDYSREPLQPRSCPVDQHVIPGWPSEGNSLFPRQQICWTELPSVRRGAFSWHLNSNHEDQVQSLLKKRCPDPVINHFFFFLNKAQHGNITHPNTKALISFKTLLP